MKKVLTMILSLTLLISMTACQTQKPEEGKYTPGTYSAQAQGFGGTVTATITTDANAVTEVVLEGAEETPAIGGAALETLAAAVKEAGSAEIDGVSGATVTSNAVKTAVSQALDQALGKETAKAELKDGTYPVKSTGYSWTGMISADVTIEGGRLAGIAITEEHESETGEMAQTAFDALIPRMIEAQSLAVDNISGATATSNAIRDLAAQAITAAGGDPAQWQTPVEKKSDIVKLEGYDVIVVGLGGSGILSYCAAAESGATVFGIETTAKLGGQSASTTGPMVINSKNEAYQDVTFANPDDVYKTWIDYVETEEKADIIHEAVYNSGTYLDYYIDQFGFEFAGMIMSFAKPEWSQFWTRYVGENGTSNIFGPTKTNQFNRAMDKAAALNEKNGYQLELTAQELLFNNGEIAGVKAVSYDGTVYEIYGDAVILATGGFGYNVEMRMHYDQSLTGDLLCSNAPGTLGEGIVMAEAVGASLINMEYIELYPMADIYDGGLHNSIPNAINHGILVNTQGDRFIREDAGRDELAEAIRSQEHGFVYSIADDDFSTLQEDRDFLEGLVLMGQVVKADSLDELARLLDLDPVLLNTAIADYNRSVEAQNDPRFHRKTLINKIDHPPFYATAKTVTVHHTLGGVEINERTQVLNSQKQPIPHLFAAGEVTGGIHGANRLGGNSFPDCIVFGRIAGTEAARN